MDRKTAIRALCRLQTDVSDLLGYDEASDGFCDVCARDHGAGRNYANSGRSIAYIIDAVREKIKHDRNKLREEQNGI